MPFFGDTPDAPARFVLEWTEDGRPFARLFDDRNQTQLASLLNEIDRKLGVGARSRTPDDS